jgi:hypothetical protein
LAETLASDIAILALLEEDKHSAAVRAVRRANKAGSRLLVVSTFAIAAVAIGLPYLGSAAWVFGLVPLPLPLLGSGIAIVVLYVLATEIGKRWFYGRAARVQAKPAATILPPPH